jgi:hypothetical protein
MRNGIIALSYCIILLSQYLYGDNVIIADKELKTPISAAVVSVWIENSDVALKLISDDSGIVKIPKNATRLTVRKLGYEEQKLNARIYSEGDTIFLEMGYILREVTVSAIRNKFHVKSDRYVYDVASDSALVGKSAFEALGRIPILNTTIDGHISSMQGKNLVYKVNGLSSLTFTGDLQTALRSLKADYIKRIELKSDPMGNNPNTLEINIVTKGRLEGYQANATTRLNDYSWRTSLWGLTKINKFCVSGSYYYMLNHDHKDKDYLEEMRGNSENQLSYVRETTNSGYRAHSNNAELSMSYDVDDYTIISAYGRILAKTNPYTSSHSNTVIRSENLLDLVAYNQSSKTTFDDKEYSANINFEKIYGENGENGKLFIGYDFYKRPNSSLQKVRYDVTLCNDSSLLPQLEKYDRREFVDLTMHTAMTEYRWHFLRKHTIFANVMYRFRSDVDDDSLGTNIENIKLKQHLLDGSLAYKFAVERFSLYCGVGVRSYNDRVTNSKYGPEYSYSRRNLIWQPTLTMSFVPNSKQRYELSYSMTSLIPDISVMNPFVFQDEPTRVSYGNPGISPEKNQKLSLSANYNLNKLYFSTSISGGYASDVILKYSFLDGKNILNTTYDNIANRWNLGISSFLTWNITRKTSLRTNLSLDYIDYSSHRLNSSNSGVQFSGNVNLSQELPFGIYGELRGNYNTPWINFQGKGGTNYGYGVSLARNFLSNKLRVSLSAENFAPTYYSRTYTTLGEGYYQTRKSRRFHAYYSLTVSYSFGNLRARVKETETSISNTDIKSSYDE